VTVGSFFWGSVPDANRAKFVGWEQSGHFFPEFRGGSMVEAARPTVSVTDNLGNTHHSTDDGESDGGGDPKIMGYDVSSHELLGFGAFGEVRIGRRGSSAAAFKFASDEPSRHLLEKESRIYGTLGELRGIPRVVGYEPGVLAMELLGPSLEWLFQMCDRKFCIRTILWCGIQMLRRVQECHSRGVVHRDIKPDNFCLGGPDRNLGKPELYAVDFGLAKQVVKGAVRVKRSFGKRFVGTTRYASVHAHEGCEQWFRDDLISVGYCLVYLCRGRLPWQGLQIENPKKRREAVGKEKKTVSVEDLCRGCPSSIFEYMNYCNALKFGDIPDYAMARSLFGEQFVSMGFSEGGSFEWSVFYDSSNKRRMSNPRRAGSGGRGKSALHSRTRHATVGSGDTFD
jgi:casein kinase I homolog HRR25